MRITTPFLLGAAAALAWAPACDDAGTSALGPDVTTAPDGGDTTADPGLGIDYGATTGGAVPRYEPGATDLYAVGWPSDTHRDAAGHPDLTRFPNPFDLAFIDDYLVYGTEALDGFSRNGAIYFQLSASVDVRSLPSDADSMNDPRAVVQLVDLTAGSPARGRRLPLVFSLIDDPADPYLLGPTLAMRPVYGFPLADAGRYCAVVTRAVRDSAFKYLEPAPAFTDALANDPGFADLRAWLADDSPLAQHDLAAATCFTTQDATADMRAIQRVLEARPTTALRDVEYPGPTSALHLLTAVYDGPNFQAGVKPYTNTGGDIQYDAGGDPIVQEAEAIRVRILIPRGETMPAAGWPVVLYSHGTGGNWKSCTDATGTDVLDQGLAMLCIDQPLHGVRGVGDDDNYLNSFNYLNPRSGRTSFRQAAADTIWLTRMIADGRFDLPAGADPEGKAPGFKLDPATIVFFGHSHGGLAGVIVLGVDPRVKGAILSGASGVLVETILRRKDPLDIRAVLAATTQLEPEQLDTFHPIMTLAQTLVDATDPINYAPYWLEPITGGDSKHVFMTEGIDDEASPAVGADAVAAAAGMPLIQPVAAASRAHELKGLAPAALPLNSNLQSSTGTLITAGLKQFADGDHFVAFDQEARRIWRGFLRAFVDGDVPTIQVQ